MPDTDQATAEAQEQADTYDSFARSATVTAPNGDTFTVRNPLFFNADQLSAYNRLHHRMNQCDRWPDVEKPEQRMKSRQPDGTEVETFVGAHTVRGEYIEPYQENGVLVEPPYEVQVCQIVMGDDVYTKFAAAGGSPREVVERVKELRSGLVKRADADSKVMQAFAFWRMAPRQIASDLRRFFPGCHIRDWHQGRMSSYELLELFGVTVNEDAKTETRTITVDWPPEGGAVAAVVRDGERPEWQKMLAQVANISALFRSVKLPNADTEMYGEQLFFPISKTREFVETQRAVAEGELFSIISD
ncbi:tail assembly chaperone [Mycobacterium phage Xeno]|uniref:Tail assembly chaperone n=3 Tax=Charlievirus TaxID=1623280 RepID=A0A142K7L6_9CAUD|nr:tail assembly chaperone [Mycobacterium phage Xeno]YP_010052086.1 tail assembly chaperone [Mycobacterium phage Andies]YP_010052151.1 tail assembly chaperone [Mycobacterium phage Fulbright]QZD97228.1 tail assembly chaperone [Mycobacterium phage Magsby]AMS02099.1 tail assembly chaperone [Mycobacterium phage Xeno]ATW61048.1 tail assembly chaperone [Mycobacterium phage Andies]QDF19832.1 tail assembly chaperone [Mycobacterium phage Fulbright]